MNKHIISSLLIFALIFGILLSLPTSAQSSTTNFHSRTDFSFGVNGHNNSMQSYPESTLEQQISLAAELGVKIYRFNLNPVSVGQYNYLNKVLDLTDKYGLELMLVTDDLMQGRTLQAVYDRFYKIAEYYDGRIPYIQIFNEVDVYCMQGAPVAGDGSVVSHYNATRLADMTERFNQAQKGIDDASSKIKSVINFAYRHTYLLTNLKNAGVKWDITGLDWYQDMAHGQTGDYGYKAILTKIENYFPQDIIICETNIWPIDSSKLDEYENDVTYLPECMEYVYNNHPRVKGMIFYELLDEPQFAYYGYSNEAHFGLVKMDKYNSSKIGEKKPIYYKIQEMLKNSTPTTTTTTIVTTSTTSPTTQVPVIYGDANGDKLVNALDLLTIKKYLVLLNPPMIRVNSDINSDGKINAVDLLLLKKHIVGIPVRPWAF